MANNYVPIHVHTNFSLLDGLTRPKDLVDKTIKLGMPAVVVTDHGNLYHVVDTAQYAEKKGQKYIPGFEAYMVDNAKEKNKEELHSSDDGIARKHFLLLAKNNDGYKRLMKICSWGLTDGFYARPRIDNSVLEYFGTDGLIASSACFVDGTLVNTRDCKKNITSVIPGDYVPTHTGEYKKVLNTTNRIYSGELYSISVNDYDINCTADHKFYVWKNNKAIWTKAEDLSEDSYLMTPVDSINASIEYNDVYYQLRTISKISHHSVTNIHVYCLNVEDNHSFLVNDIIVHNCIAGPIAQKLVHDDYAGAKKLCEYYARLFKDGFYLEIQPTYQDNGRQVIANKGLIELSKDIGLPLIATTDAHYLNKEDAKTHDVLLCLQSKSLVSDPNRWRFPGDTYYIMDRNELTNSFKINGHEVLDQKLVQEAMDNTLDIAEKCNVTFKWGNHVLPKINPPKLEEEPELMPKFYMFEGNRVEEQVKEYTFNYDNKPADYNGSFDVKKALTDADKSYEYLRFLCLHGRYGAFSKHHCTREYLDRMDYELDVIKSMEFPSYFLVEYDIMDHCHKTGIPVGPGRGCFIKGCMVKTHDGLKNIDEIISGEYVLSHDGKEHKVIDKHIFDCAEDVVNIECTDGSEVTGATKDHRIFAIKKYDYDNGLRQPQWIPADELQPGDLIASAE